MDMMIMMIMIPMYVTVSAIRNVDNFGVWANDCCPIVSNDNDNDNVNDNNNENDNDNDNDIW